MEDLLREKVKEIDQDPIGRWVGTGDYGEYITARDYRWEPNQKVFPEWLEQDDIGQCIEDKACEILEPIAYKCDGLLYGNHDDDFRRHNHQNVHKHICKRLGVRNLGFSCQVRYLFHRENSNEKHMFKGCFTHGSTGSITDEGKLKALKRFMSYFPFADFYAYAHTHAINQHYEAPLDVNRNDEIIDRNKVGVLTGCFFRTYTQGPEASYGERKLFSPNMLGCPKLIIDVQKGKIEADITG